MTAAATGTSGQRIEVPCRVEIENTAESLHAHAIPDGVEIGPGDTVLVHGAPSHVDYGKTLVADCSATVIRAGLLGRLWTRLAGLAELTELYEVGFQPKEQL